jgi:hypothetical protein
MIRRVSTPDRRGIVFIAWCDHEDEQSCYSGYWDGAAGTPRPTVGVVRNADQFSPGLFVRGSMRWWQLLRLS